MAVDQHEDQQTRGDEMTPSEFLETILDPGLAWCGALPGWKIPFDPRASVLLLAIAGQESDWQDIAQYGGGPARGPWQFEDEACGEVLVNSASSVMAHAACTALSIKPTETAVYQALIGNPNLAVAFARLNLWCDPNSLPAAGDMAAAYACYLRVWRPGAPSYSRWETVYPAALASIQGTPTS
jgi:hypothetical protein